MRSLVPRAKRCGLQGTAVMGAVLAMQFSIYFCLRAQRCRCALGGGGHLAAGILGILDRVGHGLLGVGRRLGRREQALAGLDHVLHNATPCMVARRRLPRACVVTRRASLSITLSGQVNYVNCVHQSPALLSSSGDLRSCSVFSPAWRRGGACDSAPRRRRRRRERCRRLSRPSLGR